MFADRTSHSRQSHFSGIWKSVDAVVVAVDILLREKLIEMRLMSILFRNARQPQNEKKVPFKTKMPMKLKDFVSSKNQRITEKGCLHEMSLLLTCLEENEFEDKKCIPQFKVLDQCFQVYTENKNYTRFTQQQVTPVPNSKNLTSKQITYLLRRYPTV